MSDGPDPSPPGILREVAERFVTCEAATLTRDGWPVTWPLTPYPGERGGTVDVSTGLTYPAKAERSRRDPRTALLFSDPTGSGMERPPVVLMRGLATVRDRDLQGNADRYVRLSMAKLPRAWRWTPGPLIRAQRWYFARIWVSVTPLEVLWWPGGDVDRPAERWRAPDGTAAPTSDPAPGRAPPPWRDRPADWRARAERALAYCPRPVLTVVGSHGFPVPFRVTAARVEGDGLRLRVPVEMPAEPAGPACLTFHEHGDPFVGQRNAAIRGSAVRERERDEVRFKVERPLGDFSIPGGRLRRSVAFLGAGRRLAPRLRREAERRGQAVPRVNLPPRQGRAG